MIKRKFLLVFTGVAIMFCSFECIAHEPNIDIAKTSQGVWVVYKNDVADGFQSIDYEECVRWVEKQYNVHSTKINVSRSPADSNRLGGLCGIKFGDTCDGITVEVGYDKGLLSKGFIPRKAFDEFTTCYTLSTPKTHKICEIVLLIDKSTAFADRNEIEKTLKARIPELKGILLKKYAGAKVSDLPEGVRFDFIGAALTMSYVSESGLKDMWGNLYWMHKNIRILAKDHTLYEQGKREAKELESEKMADSADAL